MNRIQYLLHCVKHLDFQRFRDSIRDTANVSHRPSALIVGDMIWCGLRYQAGYNDYREFDFWNLSGRQRRTYNTRGKNNSIVRRYNSKEKMAAIEDKGNFYAACSEFLHRQWLDLRKSTQEDFLRFVQQQPTFIAKPPNGYGGRGIDKITLEGSPEELYRSLVENGQMLVEEVIVQHPDLAELYPHSVNTLRMFTFFDGTEGHLLQAILKLGNEGKFLDNFSSGGMYTFLDMNGKALYPAVDGENHVYEVHPMTGQSIIGFQVPFFEEAKEMVCKAAAVTPELGYIGWDVAISESGPLIVEGNEFPGVFEPKGRFLRSDQYGSLTEYRKYMKV